MPANLTSPELIRKLLSTIQPQAVLQIGSGQPEDCLALCESLGETGMLTLVEPQFHADKNCRALWKILAANGWDNSVDVIDNPADQALPDFFFQEQVYDMAVLNALPDAAQNFVVLYYLGKLLPQGALLLVQGADRDTVKLWLRHLLGSRQYRVHAQNPASPETPLLEKILRSRYQKLPAWVRAKIEDMIKPEIITADADLGLSGPLLVLEKLKPTGQAVLDVEQMIAELT